MLIQPFTSFYAHADIRGSQSSEAEIHYATFTHWIECAKFDQSINSDAISELLLMPSEAAVRSASKKLCSMWRSDWKMVRPKLLSLGVAYFVLNSGYGASMQSQIKRELSKSGLSDALANSIYERGLEMAGAQKVAIVANPSMPMTELNRKLSALSKKLDQLFIVCFWRGRYSIRMLHEWAVGSCIPILYRGKPDARVVGPQSSELLECADHYVVFDKRGARELEQLVSELRSRSKSVEVVYWHQNSQNRDLFSRTSN